MLGLGSEKACRIQKKMGIGEARIVLRYLVGVRKWGEKGETGFTVPLSV